MNIYFALQIGANGMGRLSIAFPVSFNAKSRSDGCSDGECGGSHETGNRKVKQQTSVEITFYDTIIKDK